MLWSKSKKLHSLNKIHSFFISDDTIKIRVNENILPLLITHVADLGKHFPAVDLSPSSCTSQINVFVLCFKLFNDIVELY